MAENKKNKPWAILKVSRRQYCTARPLTRAGMSREQFEEMIAILPEGMIDEIQLEADAERLIAAAFGGDFLTFDVQRTKFFCVDGLAGNPRGDHDQVVQM